MTSKHTPGPWQWENGPYDNGNPYITLRGGSGFFPHGFEINGIFTEEDARLMSAAPDLAVACQAAIEELNRLAMVHYGEHYGECAASLWCKQALAKAGIPLSLDPILDPIRKDFAKTGMTDDEIMDLGRREMEKEREK